MNFYQNVLRAYHAFYHDMKDAVYRQVCFQKTTKVKTINIWINDHW